MPIKVHYFDLYARAEPTRMMLSKAGVAFEDIRVTGDSWKELKESGKLEYGQIPMVELEDGTRLVQQRAIEQYFAATHGFNATEPMDIYKSEHLLCLFWEDFFGKHLYKTMFADAESKPALVEALFSTHVPALYAGISRKLSGKKFILGDSLKHIDFVILGWIVNVVLNGNNPMHAQWTASWEAAPANLKETVANFQEEMKEYLANRPNNCSM